VSVDIYWFLPIISGTSFRESWPYGPAATGFHPDLAIDVDPDVRSTQPVLAPVAGTLMIFPDATLKTCSVLLTPRTEVTQAFLHDSIGELAFYIRTLDLADLVQRFTSTVTEKLSPKVTAEQQIQNLAAGKIPVDVLAGEDIALLAPAASGNNHGLLQFEVLYAPNRGAFVGPARAVQYARRLVDPQLQARRLDPMAFYFKVRRGIAFQTQIAQAHANHPFWTAPLTKRGLVEVREERDRPLAIDVQLQTNGAPPVTISLTQNNWAHYEAIQNNGSTGPVDLAVQKPSWRFTYLPSFARSSIIATNQEEIPFHFAVQSIYMDAAANSASWFVPNTAPLSFFTEKNTVEPLVDGTATYAEMVSWLKRVNSNQEFVWLAGWWCSSRFQMVAGDSTTEFRELAKSVLGTGARLRVILWNQTPPGLGWIANRNTANDIEDIVAAGSADALVIRDAQTRAVGSHHQKFMVVYINPSEAVVFCGGIDINPNRLDTPQHIDPSSAYHDVHAKLTGPTIQDFMHLFAERWNDHAEVIADQGKKVTEANSAVQPTTGDCFVQVTRTMPKGTHQSLPNGAQGSYNAVRNAVRRAERYIYIEDQYLVPYWGHVPFDATQDLGIVQDLINALQRIRFLIIVIPNHMLTPQMRYRRHEFLEALSQAAGANAAKIHVHYLKRPKPPKPKTAAGLAPNDEEVAEKDMNTQGFVIPPDAPQEYLDALGGPGASGGWPFLDEIYVHTKLWLIDDVYVKCGSMNVNRRGFTYDSEADFHAVDGALRRGKRRTALAFRNALFSEHTRNGLSSGSTAAGSSAGNNASTDMPDDVDDLLSYWLDRASKSGRIGIYDWKPDAGPDGLWRDKLDLTWQNVTDPDGR
jgi:phosphatidylserine/phosphatidylglycerophosphate/cardiolipin synthase-like enzyme